MKDSDVALTELEGEPSVSARDERYLSLEEAFAEHHQLVYRYACALTRDRALAEDSSAVRETLAAYPSTGWGRLPPIRAWPSCAAW